MDKKIAIVILAAGSSSRLGTPKQLLAYQETTLLAYIAQMAIASNLSPVIVVIPNNDKIAMQMQPLSVTTVINYRWQEGMSSSIHIGLKEVCKSDAQVDAVVFLLCDQPFVSVKLIQSIAQKYCQNQKPIIACSYKNTVGIPVLFDKTLFSELLELQGQAGAKKIITRYPQMVEVIPFAKGAIDIDTQKDYLNLLQQKA